LYLLMVVLSLLFAIAAVWLGHQLKRRYGNWNATLLAAASFVVVMGVVMLVLLRLGDLQDNKDLYGAFVTETPSVGAQLFLWTTLGQLYAPLAERVLDPVAQEARRAAHMENSAAGSVQATQ